MRRQRYTYTDDASVAVDFSPAWTGSQWVPASRGHGGREFSAARVPSAFEVRRDHTLRYRIRFEEGEWGAVRKLLEHGQRGTPITVYPDAAVAGVSRVCYLLTPELDPDDPEGFRGEPGPEPSVLEIDVEWMIVGSGTWDGVEFWADG